MRFRKGQPSANPGGRPKGSISLKSVIYKQLTKETSTALMEKLFQMALVDGDIEAFKLIAKMSGDLAHNNNNNINIENNVNAQMQYVVERSREYAKSLYFNNTQISDTNANTVVQNAVIEDKKDVSSDIINEEVSITPIPIPSIQNNIPSPIKQQSRIQIVKDDSMAIGW